MTEHTSPFFVMLRKNENGDFQIAIADNKEVAKERMINEGWRVFEMMNEQRFEDLSS